MISPALYQQVVCDIEALDLRLSDASNELTLMFNILPNITAQNTAALESEIQNVINTIVGRRTTIASQITAVIVAMHKMIQNAYGSVDVFLSTNSIQISQFVATISIGAGYPISPSNIKSSCFSSSSSG